MDLILHILCKMALWRWYLLPCLIFLPAVVRAFLPTPTGGGEQTGKRLPWLTPLCVVIAVANFLFGTAVSVLMIYHFGKIGSAVVTDSFETGTQYNDQTVFGYHVLIKTADGQTVEAQFRDDDFNVYPPHNATAYPGVGARFNVSYVASFPKDFIIISDDHSPWASRLQCEAMKADLAKAYERYEFSKTNLAYRQSYIDAIHAAMNGPCSLDETERMEFKLDLTNVQAGQ